MPHKVLINGRLVRDRISGVSRYTVEIARRLSQQTKLVIPEQFSNLLYGILWEQIWLSYQALHYDLIWSPANSGPLAVSNQVVTIHDTISHDHPEWFTRSYHSYYRFLQPNLCKKARRIITDSLFSKSRIIDVFNLSVEQVVVVPLGVGEEFNPELGSRISQAASKYQLKKPYIFIIGSLEPRKNLGTLFIAWQQIQRKYPEIELVVAGIKAGSARGMGFDEVPKGVKMIGYVDQDELSSLHSGAIAHLFPSLYEGFGLPILEAMACGTPVAASNATSIPEVVGEAGLLFDPYNIEEMAWAMERLIQDSTLRDELRLKGLERARQFTWEKTAQAVWEVLFQAMEA